VPSGFLSVPENVGVQLIGLGEESCEATSKAKKSNKEEQGFPIGFHDERS
jgi:hypothetical protein